jgi:hypothetical protein
VARYRSRSPPPAALVRRQNVQARVVEGLQTQRLFQDANTGTMFSAPVIVTSMESLGIVDTTMDLPTSLGRSSRQQDDRFEATSYRRNRHSRSPSPPPRHDPNPRPLGHGQSQYGARSRPSSNFPRQSDSGWQQRGNPRQSAGPSRQGQQGMPAQFSQTHSQEELDKGWGMSTPPP